VLAGMPQAERKEQMATFYPATQPDVAVGHTEAQHSACT